jgi:lipopolysaccharide biosynthesis glycosyltransferase
MSDLRVFIGYEPRQPVAYQVCAQSIWEHASKPVSITRLDLSKLPITRRGLTEFTYSRFLVPYLSNFEGYSLFLDSDILVRGDVHELVRNDAWGHVQIVKGERKFEWASVMLFDNECFKHLTPDYIENPVNRMYDWAWSERMGDLPKEYNHLVGYDAPNPAAKIVHFTMGLPIWEETKNSEFAREWWNTYKRMNSSVSFAELMGRSVHVPHIDKLKVTA